MDNILYGSWIHQFKDRTIKAITLGVGFIAYLPIFVDTITVRPLFLPLQGY